MNGDYFPLLVNNLRHHNVADQSSNSNNSNTNRCENNLLLELLHFERLQQEMLQGVVIRQQYNAQGG
jgi:hypothetical protein